MVLLHTLNKKRKEGFDYCKNKNILNSTGLENRTILENERFYQFDKMSIDVEGVSETLSKEGCDNPCSSRNTTVVKFNDIPVLAVDGIHYRIISDFINDITKFIYNRRDKADILVEIKKDVENAIVFKMKKAVADGPKYINIATLVWKDDLPKLGEVKIVPLPSNFDGTGIPYDVMRSNMLDKISLQGGTVDCPLMFKIHAIVEEEKECVLYTTNNVPVVKEDNGDRKIYVTITANKDQQQ